MCQLAGDGTATATIQEPQLKIYLTDAEFTTPIDVTDNEPVEVHVGESVTLTTGLNGQGPAATWVLPGNGEVIKSYVPTLPKNQLTQLGVAGVGVNAGSRVVSNSSSSITFEWVGGGDASVAATVRDKWRNTTVHGSRTGRGRGRSRPVRPHDRRRERDTYIRKVSGGLRLPANGENDLDATGADRLGIRLGILLRPDHNVSVDFYGAIRTRVRHGRRATTSPRADRTGLDTKFPYVYFIGDPVLDTPGIRIRQFGGTLEYYITATTYFMCKPDTAFAPIGSEVWVPLAELSWSYWVKGVWKTGSEDPTILCSVGRTFGDAWSDIPDSPTSTFRSTTNFPQWTTPVSTDKININLIC